MCLIAFAWQAHPQFDLLLAGNRDEFHARPAAPLALHAASGIAGGRDLQAGGRWLGLATSGRFAAVTNVRRGVPEATRPRSRGDLVENWLRGSDDPAAHLDQLAAHAADYARFNLLCADVQGMGYAGNAEGWRIQPVSPGLHVLSNAALDTPWPKTRQLASALTSANAALDSEPDEAWVSLLLGVLQRREPAADAELPDTGIGRERERALSSPFVALGPYGTRCSSLLLRRRDGHWWMIEQRYDAHGAVNGCTTLHGNRHGLRHRASGADFQAAALRG